MRNNEKKKEVWERKERRQRVFISCMSSTVKPWYNDLTVTKASFVMVKAHTTKLILPQIPRETIS